MKNIQANIICDSLNPSSVRLTTFVLTYPRFIHAEFMTHRAISRNAASSRAIPIEKAMEAVRVNAAMPEQWGANQKGMQAAEIVADIDGARYAWYAGARAALKAAASLNDFDLHKQIVNRVLEPFSHITVVATADQFGWANFFALRAHPMAQPEFQVLAYRMLATYLREDVRPRSLEWGEWHLPFICADDHQWNGDDYPNEDYETLPVKLSTARCARVSYLNHEGVRSVDDDLKLYARLRDARPVHASAFEHAAQAFNGLSASTSNFDSTWYQHRKEIEGESTRSLDLNARLAGKPEWIAL